MRIFPQSLNADKGWLTAALVIAALAAIPLLAIFWALPSGGFSAWNHIASTTLPTYLTNTVALMVMVGIISAAIGISTAWLTSAVQFPGRKIFTWALVLPLAAPPYIIAYIYTDLLDFSGPVQSSLRAMTGWKFGDYYFPEIRSLPGAALMLGLVLYPYIYLLARTAFAAQSMSQFNAARSLGAKPVSAFFRIALPAARLSIVGGLALVLMETLADFGVADYFAIPTFSTGIFRSWLAMGDKAGAMKLAAIMLLFVFLLIWMEAASRRGRVDANDAMSRSNASPIRLSGIKACLAFSACALPIIFGFAVPVMALLNYAISVGDGQHWSTLATYGWASIKLAAIVAVIAISLALLLAYAQRQSSSKAVKTAIRISTLGYALPGALLAVGLLTPLGLVDQSIARFARDVLGLNSGLILSASGALLIYALTVRFLTVSFNTVSGAMAKIPPSMDAAARSLGAGPLRLVRTIHLPMLRMSLATGGALVFIDVLRELPATLILRPFNLETLATRVYRLASDERLAEASTAALLIIAVGLIPVLLANRVRS